MGTQSLTEQEKILHECWRNHRARQGALPLSEANIYVALIIKLSEKKELFFLVNLFLSLAVL